MPPNLAQLKALDAAPPAGGAEEMVSCVTPPRPAAAASAGWELGSNAKLLNPVRIAPLAPASAEAGSGAKEAELPGTVIGAVVTAGAQAAVQFALVAAHAAPHVALLAAHVALQADAAVLQETMQEAGSSCFTETLKRAELTTTGGWLPVTGSAEACRLARLLTRFATDFNTSLALPPESAALPGDPPATGGASAVSSAACATEPAESAMAFCVAESSGPDADASVPDSAAAADAWESADSVVGSAVRLLSAATVLLNAAGLRVPPADDVASRPSRLCLAAETAEEALEPGLADTPASAAAMVATLEVSAAVETLAVASVEMLAVAEAAAAAAATLLTGGGGAAAALDALAGRLRGGGSGRGGGEGMGTRACVGGASSTSPVKLESPAAWSAATRPVPLVTEVTEADTVLATAAVAASTVKSTSMPPPGSAAARLSAAPRDFAGEAGRLLTEVTVRDEADTLIWRAMAEANSACCKEPKEATV